MYDVTESVHLFRFLFFRHVLDASPRHDQEAADEREQPNAEVEPGTAGCNEAEVSRRARERIPGYRECGKSDPLIDHRLAVLFENFWRFSGFDFSKVTAILHSSFDRISNGKDQHEEMVDKIHVPDNTGS